MEKTQQTITVLGKTFNSEEERRNYFREELKKKLPELKQMEGFPIGEDEDILTLSDPPYYTACPNPWLNDFVAEWEEEKKQLEESGLRSADFEVDEPYAADVSEGKNNPIYNSHTYHTKVPHPAIMRYLMQYTQPGDVVLDGFAGTGMTGVAGNFCSQPESQIKYSIEAENPYSKWGKRNVICNDLSTIASFIAYGFNGKKDLLAYRKRVSAIIDEVEQEYSWMYSTIDPDSGKTCPVNYVVWSDVYQCGSCLTEHTFWDFAVSKEKYKVNTEFNCPSCQSLQTKKSLIKSWRTDILNGQTFREVKQFPVQISYRIGRSSKFKNPDQNDFAILDRINSLQITDWFPDYEISQGDKTSDPINKGVTKIFQLYTKRNLITLSSIKARINKLDVPYYNFVMTALDHGMSKRVKHGDWSFPMSILNGTLYLPSLTRENTPFNFYRTKLKKQAEALIKVNDNNLISTGSATQLLIEKNSIDYIFVDPPFGKNIMYSELNISNESWIKVRTNNKTEAIENRTQNKNVSDYQNLMYESFKEFYRVLKPSRWMTVEFSNTSAAVWNAIQSSLQRAGFVISNVTALDKEIGSFNAVNSLTAVKQDLVISCYKPSLIFNNRFDNNSSKDVAVWDFIDEHLKHLPVHILKDNATAALIERTPKILFDRLIAFYVQKGLPVPIDASAFQIGLRDKYIQRDGMYFNNEQVQEYDQKKSANPEFIQLSILISSEQDGVLWLKNLLTEISMAYQEIQPLWIQALAGTRKGDVIPELAAILDDNFLKDEQGKWFVPNPEKEADLEKLRTKRLLKQFEAYKIEAFKPKGKIKEVRVEALRVGFKDAYQEKDFKTIVQIGDRIPNNLLMEDEVLLQFYDIAVSRV